MKEVEWIGSLDNEFDEAKAREAALKEFAEWIVNLDDDDPESPGRQERRTITLTKIIERAREALA